MDTFFNTDTCILQTVVFDLTNGTFSFSLYISLLNSPVNMDNRHFVLWAMVISTLHVPLPSVLTELYCNWVF